MKNKLSQLSVKSEIKLYADIEKVWNLFSEPSHLELFHPFCKFNKTIIWDEQKKQINYITVILQKKIKLQKKN